MDNDMPTQQPADITVEIVYALPDKQTLLTFKVPAETTVKAGIQQSGILDKHEELNLNELTVGIFGKKTQMDQLLREKDRIEIYRPLIADPKEVRKRKAAEGKKLKKGGANNTAENTQ
jgi:putative ubiquitin-RnfH superfamily antitoxin RatB of RatAB toxin-antitoxin module